MPSWTSGYNTNLVLTAGMATGGWLDFRGGMDKLSGSVVASPDGGNFAAGASKIAQSVSGLTIGQTYQLSFYEAATYMAVNGFASGQYTPPANATGAYDVTFGSQTQTATQLAINKNSWLPWQLQTMYFTATSTTQTLTFEHNYVNISGDAPGSVYMLLDGVSLTASAMPVPEPASVLMFTGGFGALGFLRLRSRRREQNQPA